MHSNREERRSDILKSLNSGSLNREPEYRAQADMSHSEYYRQTGDSINRDTARHLPGCAGTSETFPHNTDKRRRRQCCHESGWSKKTQSRGTGSVPAHISIRHKAYAVYSISVQHICHTACVSYSIYFIQQNNERIRPLAG